MVEKLKMLVEKFTRYLLNKQLDCKECKGTGFKYFIRRIDSITTLGDHEPCLVCGQYGKYPRSRLLNFLIKRVESW